MSPEAHQHFRADGSIDYAAALAAGRRARSAAFWRVLHKVFSARRRGSVSVSAQLDRGPAPGGQTASDTAATQRDAAAFSAAA